MAMKHFSSIIS